MVDIPGMNSAVLANVISSAGGMVVIVFWALLIGGALAGLLVWIVNIKKWNKVITVKVQTGTHKVVRFGKARDLTDPDGSVWWLCTIKGVGKKVKSLIPPKEAISVLANGKLYAEGELTPSGEISWIIPNNYVSRSISPEEKAVLAEEFENSEAWNSAKNKGGFEKIMQIANLMMPFMIIALLVFGAGEYMSPAIKLNEQNLQYQKQNIDTMNIIKEMNQDIREIKSEVVFSNTRNSTGRTAPQ
jgi:hypothetical protein